MYSFISNDHSDFIIGCFAIGEVLKTNSIVKYFYFSTVCQIGITAACVLHPQIYSRSFRTAMVTYSWRDYRITCARCWPFQPPSTNLPRSATTTRSLCPFSTRWVNYRKQPINVDDFLQCTFSVLLSIYFIRSYIKRLLNETIFSAFLVTGRFLHAASRLRRKVLNNGFSS